MTHLPSTGRTYGVLRTLFLTIYRAGRDNAVNGAQRPDIVRRPTQSKDRPLAGRSPAAPVLTFGCLHFRLFPPFSDSRIPRPN